eukprot:CAMPEP_0182595946 /NCGR_PEP_ID=MMETSP1324-20130603/83296_1 /TAXON_ID=236786 /ORGANISM="Florenciella sp., Strain RCC1587" /LENGTH=31 /DNA_ID= /DNA_START= /DNA_END= /DNA_ORIENTATION=
MTEKRSMDPATAQKLGRRWRLRPPSLVARAQ